MKRHEKTALAKELVVQMKIIGGARFLKQRPGHGVWEVVDDEAAREKVSHTFRSLRPNTKLQQQQQQQHHRRPHQQQQQQQQQKSESNNNNK